MLQRLDVEPKYGNIHDHQHLQYHGYHCFFLRTFGGGPALIKTGGFEFYINDFVNMIVQESFVTLLRIRIQRRAKITYKIEKVYKFHILKCSMFSLEG